MFCPECKAELPEDAKFCIRCGYDFTRIKTPPPDQPSDLLGRLRTSPRPDQPEASFDFGETLKKGEVFARRYRILSDGKRGGMGVVYKCEDQKLSRTVALKVIHPRLLSSDQAIKRFRQEVSISLELLHRNIVRVHNLDEYEGIEFFTMEWVEGKSLREILNEKMKEKTPFNLEEAHTIISQLSDALQYAHKSTVHRDIKPENILTYKDEEGLHIKVTDFGIAKMLTPAQFTTTSLQIGTPYYMAPEQKVDAAHVDKRADIYAVGVVLFELLTLENTIGLEMPSEINKELPKEIDQVIKRAVATKPENRYGDIRELSDGLGNIVQIWKRKVEEERRRAEELKKKEEDQLRQETEEAEKRRREEGRKRKEEDKRSLEELRRKEEEEKRKEEQRKRQEEERIQGEEEEKKSVEEAKERALWLIERGKESESAGKYQEALNYYREANRKSIYVSAKDLIREVERKIKEEEDKERKRQEEERRLAEERKRAEELERKRKEEEEAKRKKRNTALWSGLAVIGMILLIIYFVSRKTETPQVSPPAPKEETTQVSPPAPPAAPPIPAPAPATPLVPATPALVPPSATLIDFSKDITSQFETYYWPYAHSQGANVGMIYDAYNRKIILQGVGGYGHILMKLKNSPPVHPSQDFEFSYDVSILSEFNGQIYLGDLKDSGDQKSKSRSTWLRWGIDSHDRIFLLRVHENGEMVINEKIPLTGISSVNNLKVKREKGRYHFYCNEKLIHNRNIDFLADIPLYYGAWTAISSGPSGYTAKITVDNWRFSTSLAPVTKKVPEIAEKPTKVVKLTPAPVEAENEAKKKKAEELVRKGESSENTGQYKEALELYKEARKVSLDIPEVDRLIAGVERKIQEEQVAREKEVQLKKAEELKSKGESNERTGKYDEALQFYREAKNFFPNLSGINELIANAEKTIKLEEQKKKAEELISKGKASEEAGKYEEAIQFYKEAKKVFSGISGIDGLITGVEKKIAEQEQKKKDRKLKIGQVWHEPVTGMELVFVEGGCYQMGDIFQTGNRPENPVHEVCLDDFWMGKFEVTQGQWEKIMGNNPSRTSKGSNHPVEGVSWDDTQEFIKELNQRTGKKFRLPTEAEWEYACRSGGKREKWAGTSNQSEFELYRGGHGYYRTLPVGSARPNGLGLYDMIGNVYEWVQDTYNAEAYKNHSRNNPVYTGDYYMKVFRGGCYYTAPEYSRCTLRGGTGHMVKYSSPQSSNYGFRLVMGD